MRLEVHPTSRKRRVLPLHTGDYAAFREDFHSDEDESELHLLEKFHAARALSLFRDVDTFMDPLLYDPEEITSKLNADLAGVAGDILTAVFCETEPPGEALIKHLEMVDESENSKALLVYPFKMDADSIDSNFPEAMESGKFRIEHLSWRDRVLEKAFRRAIEVMDILCNETRVKMLLPLLEKPQGKKHFREEINPKLIYENVPLLRTYKLINELSDDLYDLTPMGKAILGEYVSFMEKVRNLLEKAEKK